MRKALDWTYNFSNALAVVFLAGIAVIVLAQIIGRFIGFSVPSANEISGFFVAASASLGLAATFQKGGHVRVSLLLQHFQPRFRKWIEVWCLLVSLGIVIYFTRWSFDLVIGSIRFNDVSPGILSIPLWIPQSAMMAGFVLFCVSLLDNLWITLVLNGKPAYRVGENDETKGEW